MCLFEHAPAKTAGAIDSKPRYVVVPQIEITEDAFIYRAHNKARDSTLAGKRQLSLSSLPTKVAFASALRRENPLHFFLDISK